MFIAHLLILVFKKAVVEGTQLAAFHFAVPQGGIDAGVSQHFLEKSGVIHRGLLFHSVDSEGIPELVRRYVMPPVVFWIDQLLETGPLSTSSNDVIRPLPGDIEEHSFTPEIGYSVLFDIQFYQVKGILVNRDSAQTRFSYCFRDGACYWLSTGRAERMFFSQPGLFTVTVAMRAVECYPCFLMLDSYLAPGEVDVLLLQLEDFGNAACQTSKQPD